MQAAYTTAYGGPEKIEYSEDFPKAQLVSDSHVLIRVAYAALNPIDGLQNRGALKMLSPDSHPHTFGFDVAGFVEEVGSKVTTLKKGDRVYSRVGAGSGGTLAGYVSALESVVTIAPSNLPLEESAGIPLVALTVYQSFEYANLQKGQRVFISKGAGGIGTMAIQMAKNVYGAYVITTGSEKKISLLKELGADEVIDYKKEKFEDVVKDVDLAFDVGGEACGHAKITKKNGLVIALTGIPTPKTAEQFLHKKPSFAISNILRAGNFASSRYAWWYGVRYHALFMDPSAKDLATIRGYFEDGRMKPLVDSVFELKDARKAMEKQESGRATGKVIISVDKSLDDFQK